MASKSMTEIASDYLGLSIDQIACKVEKLKLTLPYLVEKTGIKPNRIRFALYRTPLTEDELHKLSLVVTMAERAERMKAITSHVQDTLMQQPCSMNELVDILTPLIFTHQATKEDYYAALAVLGAREKDGRYSL